MDMTVPFDTNIIFKYLKKSFPGKFFYTPGKLIKIRFISNYMLSNDFLNSIKINKISGSISTPNNAITLHNCNLLPISINTSGIFDYEISASYAILGSNIKNISSLKVKYFYIEYDSIDFWIGNKILQINSNENISESIIKVKVKDKINSNIDNSRSLYIKYIATIPLGTQNDGQYTIKQNTYIGFKTDISIKVDSLIEYSHIYRNLLIFCLQKNIGISQIFFYKRSIFNHKYIKEKNNILIGFYNNQTSIAHKSALINFNTFEHAAGTIYKNWELLFNDDEYLNIFIKSYYNSIFIDQKLISLIVLLESMHNNYYNGIKRDKFEFAAYVSNVLKNIPTEYQNDVRIALSDRNSLSLTNKLLNYSIYADNENEYKNDIKKYVRFRNLTAHGAINDEFSISEITRLEKNLYNIMCKFIMKKLL